MQVCNYATAQCGARIVEVSAEGAKVASSAVNLLYGRDDLMWLTGDAPQFVTIELDEHPPIRYVGWHVWHDYLTNPKIVNFSAGITAGELEQIIECVALPGAGTQLWELASPLPETHKFVRFEIKATFAPGPTYTNYFCLFTEHPGAAFHDRAAEQQHRRINATGTGAANASTPRGQQRTETPTFGSPNPMSSLLRELDEDIRMLHPIKAVSPTKTRLLHAPQQHQPLPLPSLSVGRIESIQQSSADTSPQRPVGSGSANGGAARIDALERSMMALQAAMDAQAQELAKLRKEIAMSPRTNSGKDRTAVTEQMLRGFAEEVLAPKLQKHAKRTEAKVLQRVDEYLHELLRDVSDVAEEQVKRRLHAVALDERRAAAGMSDAPRSVDASRVSIGATSTVSGHARRHPASTHYGRL